jgi:3-hydroxyisobutyrate dehydrogenase-like beta-hydroxyacid dehydrogenase
MASSNTDRVGFIGLGDLGDPMAVRTARLVAQAGGALRVFDRRPEAIEAAIGAGAQAASSVADIAARSDIVLVCVLDDQQLIEVVAGQGGLCEGWRERPADAPVPLVVVYLTVAKDTIETIAGHAAQAGARVVDAAVSGGRHGAEQGTLAVMVGAADEDFERCKPYFEAVGSHVFHVDRRPGYGQIAKLCNNMTALCNAYATLEGVKLAAAYGIDEQMMADIIAVSTGGSWWTRNLWFIDRLNTAHTLTGTLGIQYIWQKDMNHAVNAGRAAGVPLHMAAAAVEAGPQIMTERENLARARAKENATPDS